jgi:hypothetical protein
MTTRRNFIKQAVTAGVACSMPHHLFAQETPVQKMIWANLLHLSVNMWTDRIKEPYRDLITLEDTRARGFRPSLTFDENVWNTLLKDMAAAGMNMVVIDLGDAVLYESHPEIAVKNAWTPEKLKNELVKMRKLGLEPIPKLNFSTGHDAWLGEYSRMVSTKKYYEVCRNLIHEVIRIFDTPRFFHLGMDEEDAYNQRNYDYVVIRQNDLWWGDLYFFIGEVEKMNVRSWIWSDYAWTYPDAFFKKMPKSVLQSNWYYGSSFDFNHWPETEKWPDVKLHLELYQKLEAHGYDQIPTGSNWSSDKNMELTVDHCKGIIDKSRLLGFMTAPWRMTLPPCLNLHQEAIKQIGRAIKNQKT